MAEQLYFEDVTEGMALPVLEKNPTSQQLVKYAGASGDYYQIHYDQNYAKNNGLPDIILHGALKGSWLGQLMTDWIGEEGHLKKLVTQYPWIKLFIIENTGHCPHDESPSEFNQYVLNWLKSNSRRYI